MSRRARKVFVLLVCGALLLYFRENVLDLVGDTDRFGPPDGTLDMSALGDTPLDFDLGTYTVQIDPVAAHVVVKTVPDLLGPVFTNTKPDQPRTIFENLPGHSLLAVSSGTGRVTESRGMFKMHERAWLRYQDFQALEVKRDTGPMGSGTLSIRGRLSAGMGLFHCDAYLGFAAARDGGLDVYASADLDPKQGSLYVSVKSRPEERFFGFGEQFTKFDLKGERVPLLVSEQGIGRGVQPLSFFADLFAGAAGDWSTTYRPQADCMTTDLRRFAFSGGRYQSCDLRDPDRAVFRTASRTFHLLVNTAKTPTKLLPRPWRTQAPLPDWIHLGAVVGMQGGTDRVREIYARLNAAQAPIAAFWLQDWCGQRKTSFGKQLWWNWELDEERYPHWNELRDELRQDGVRIMTYVNPFLVDMAGKKPVNRNLFREAKEKGFLVTKDNGEPYLIPNTDFSAGLVDLCNEEAKVWMIKVIQEQVIGVGASGWMADFGESYPWEKADTGAEVIPIQGLYHNRFAAAWTETNYTACKQKGGDLVFFMRSGTPGKTPLFWEGDQLVTWDEHDGMKSAVTGLLSSGLSGMVFNHSDIGGYTTITSPIKNYHRSKELLMRWMEMNAFTVVFRTHEGNDPDKNAQFYTDDETMAHFARFAKVYAAWFPYRKELVREGSEMGLPVVRHPWIHYWTDPEVLKIVYQQFLVGSELMVAPVLAPGVAKVRVYLPAGRWVHLWTDKVYGGSVGEYIEADAPMGYPAVFYKEGSPHGIAFRDVLDAKRLRSGYPAK